MKRWWWTMAAALLALPACYANAHAARESQTMSARGFYCVGEPRVRCPNRSGGRCTGWDTTWTAVCSSDRSEWICRLDDDGSSRCRQTAAAVPRARQPRRAASRSASQTAGGQTATRGRGPRGRGGPAEVTVERDEFTGRTTVEYEAPVEWEDGRHQRADFTVLVNPRAMVGALSITTAHQRWRWLECHATHMLVNGEIVELDEADHDGRVGDGFVVEQVRVPLSRDAIVALTQASEVRVRICNDVMRLSQPSIRALAGLGPALAEQGSDEATDAERPANPYQGASDADPADSGSEDDQAGDGHEPDTVGSGAAELDDEAQQEGSL